MHPMASQKQQNDFETRFFDLLQSNLSGLTETVKSVEKKIDKNTALTQQVKAQAERTNGRVTKIEQTVYGKAEPKPTDSIWSNPKVINIIVYISLAFLLLVMAVTNLDVRKLL